MSDAKQERKNPAIPEKQYAPIIKEITNSDLNSIVLSFLDPAELKRSYARVNKDYFQQANSQYPKEQTYQQIFNVNEASYKSLSSDIKDNVDVIYSLLYTIYQTQVDAASKDILKSNGHSPYPFLFDLFLKNNLDQEITLACRQHPELAAKVMTIPYLRNKLPELDRQNRPKPDLSSRLKGAAIGAAAALKKLGLYCISLYWLVSRIVTPALTVLMTLYFFDYFGVIPPEVLHAVMDSIIIGWPLLLMAGILALCYVLAADGLNISPMVQFRENIFGFDEMLESAKKNIWELIKSPINLLISMGKCIYEGYHAGHEIAWNNFNRLAYDSQYVPPQSQRRAIIQFFLPPYLAWQEVSNSYKDPHITPHRTAFEAAEEFNKHIPILERLKEAESPSKNDTFTKGTYAQLEDPLEIKSSKQSFVNHESSINTSLRTDEISKPLLRSSQRQYHAISSDDENIQNIDFRLG